jgi:hypothetical protein
LPESGRYRVTTTVPPDPANPPLGTGHGIQSERPAPGIEHLQSVADKLLPEKAVLSDIRWSSIFRVSMRLAAHYRQGNVFIAGDAAHIHPPTGGQGMNTGIQDAYNLAWKLALVLRGAGRNTLLESYESERRAVGAEIVARTTRSALSPHRDKEDRLGDTQVLISYRGGGWVENVPGDGNKIPGLMAGDRAPDCLGLRRSGVGFPSRLFDLIRGIEHVLVVYCPDSDPTPLLSDLAAFGRELSLNGLVRLAAIITPGAIMTQISGVPAYVDADGGFANAYGSKPTAMLVRPDGAGSSRRILGVARRLVA